VGIFGAIVQAFVLAMLHARQHLLFYRAIAGQLIRDQYAWNVLAPLQQLPMTEGLVGQHDSALSQQLFDITIAERESIVEPDRVADNLGRKSLALVRG
jgi:hypothetical protein